MKSRFQALEDKYNIQVLEKYENKYQEVFYIVLDLSDNQKVEVPVRFKESLDMAFGRIFGDK